MYLVLMFLYHCSDSDAACGRVTSGDVVAATDARSAALASSLSDGLCVANIETPGRASLGMCAAEAVVSSSPASSSCGRFLLLLPLDDCSTASKICFWGVAILGVPALLGSLEAVGGKGEPARFSGFLDLRGLGLYTSPFAAYSLSRCSTASLLGLPLFFGGSVLLSLPSGREMMKASPFVTGGMGESVDLGGRGSSSRGAGCCNSGSHDRLCGIPGPAWGNGYSICDV